MDNIICLGSTFWDEPWRRRQQISIQLSHYCKVLYLEPPVSISSLPQFMKYALSFSWRKNLRKINNNLYVFPLISIFPFGRLQFIQRLNNLFMKLTLNQIFKFLIFERPILYIWDFWNAANFIKCYNSALVVFDCYDDHREFGAIGMKEKNRITENIKNVARRSDIIFASSIKLFEELKKINSNSYFVSNGVDFSNYQRQLEIPEDIKQIPHPIVGYMGGNNYERCGKLDYELLLCISHELDQYHFVFIGPINEISFKNKGLEILRQRPNIHFLGKKTPAELPAYINQFDVAIIPWKINEFTKAADPLKLYEYLSCGKPIVSTEIPDVIAFENNTGLVQIATSPNDFALKIRSSLNEDTPLLHEKRMKLAQNNSWDNKAMEMLLLIRQNLEKNEDLH